ncbi:hypothetical protein BC828DRAFT_163465 [Blastocladiella britannica]|nr:hypothetical protein BC828DRAFT_163465 [Blastocladiella britannica]
MSPVMSSATTAAATPAPSTKAAAVIADPASPAGIIAVLSRTEPFSSLTSDQLAKVAAIVQPIKLGKNTTICDEGSVLHVFAIIVQGSLKVIKNGKTVGELAPYDSIGFRNLRCASTRDAGRRRGRAVLHAPDLAQGFRATDCSRARHGPGVPAGAGRARARRVHGRPGRRGYPRGDCHRRQGGRAPPPAVQVRCPCL